MTTPSSRLTGALLNRLLKMAPCLLLPLAGAGQLVTATSATPRTVLDWTMARPCWLWGSPDGGGDVALSRLVGEPQLPG
jgi:hypothetical protein